MEKRKFLGILSEESDQAAIFCWEGDGLISPVTGLRAETYQLLNDL